MRMSAKIAELNERKAAILVEDLRLWILSQPHLNARTGDDFLRGFLRGCFYNLNETKRRIDLYYTLKNQIPSVLANRRVSKRLLDICKMGVIVDMPMYLNEKGACLYISKYANYKPSAYTYAEIMKVFFMMTEIQMMESRNARLYSIVHVIDLQGATFKHCLQFNLGLTRKIVKLFQSGLPIQVDEIHIINASNCFVWLLTFMCSFLSEGLKRKCHLHSSMESLHKHVPQMYLPIEYGGRNGSIQRSVNRQAARLMEYEEYFEEDELYGVNERLRRKS